MSLYERCGLYLPELRVLTGAKSHCARHSVSIYDRCHCFLGRLIGMIVGNIAFSMTFATTIIVGRPGSPQHAVSSS